MSLANQISKIGFTDKNTVHSYIPVYENLFRNRYETAQNVLEIGVFDGGSIKLWEDSFPNAQIYGLDVDMKRNRCKFGKRVHLLQGDAYNQAKLQELLQNVALDVAIDDGPHTLQSMIAFLKLYFPKLSVDGVLVIEDVQDIAWIPTLKQNVPVEFQDCIMVEDRRSVKNRYDDVLFIVDKSKKTL